MPLTRIDSAFLDLDAIGGIDFDVNSSVPTLKVEATNHRVGIGHNSPAYKLDVVGDVNISSGSNYLVAGSQISTANVAEDSSYLYYTDARAISAVTGSALDMGSNTITTTGAGSFASLSTGASGVGVNISASTISGPATLTIDPSAVGDNTGTVVIAGDLQVDGTTTTINSTTLTVDDKNLVLASGAANNAAADGAGITIDTAAATLLYKATPDAWVFNKNVGIGEDSPDVRLHVKEQFDTAYSLANVADEANHLLKLENPSTTANAFSGMQFRVGSGADLFFGAIQQTTNHGDFFFANQNSPQKEMVRIKSTGNVGIGEDNPNHLLHVNISSDSGTNTTTSYNTASMLRLDGTGGDNQLAGIGFGYRNGGGQSTPALSSAFIGVKVSNWTGYVTHDLVFATRDAATNIEPTERLRITAAGVVGINKISPSTHAQLDVVGSSYWPILVKTTSTSGGGVAIKNKDDVTSLYVGSGGSAWLTGSAITDGLIRAQNDLIFASNANNERLRIKSNGGVTIGSGNDDNTWTEFGSNTGGLTLDDIGVSHTGLRLSHGNDDTYLVQGGNSNFYISQYGTGSMIFGVGSSGNERLRIDSDGIITAGNGNSTGGTTLIQNYYSSPDILNVIGSHYSTGGTSICYAVRPKAGNSGFVSSAGNAAFKKAALEINGEFVFRSSGSATVPVGDDVSLSEVMKIDIDGKIGVGFAAESATLEVQGQNVYTSSANSLATSTSKAALRVKGSTNSSDSLWVGVETSNAQPYLQGANGIGTTAKNLLLNPFGADVGIGTTSPTSKLHVMGSIRVGLLATDTHESLLGTNALQFNRASSSYIDQKGTGNIKFRYGENYTTWMHLQGSTGNIGIGVDSPDVPLHVKTSANGVGKFETTSTADMSIELKNSQGSMYFGLGGGEEFAVATDSDLNGSNNLFAIKQDGKVGINTTGPTSRLHVRDDISYGKTSYASASTGSSQTRPPGTFRWGNQSPAGGSGRGYRAWVQSGDAYPSSSTYFDLMVRNAGFYRVTVKRSHSSASASVATMLIYGLANSTNSNYPVVFITGATGSGTSNATVQQGHGRGSSNAVASFYWEVHEYNINTHDTIIRIRTNASNNQGIIALVEEI